MRKWLYDNPWIWVALFLAALVAGSMVTLVIAELNKPEIVKERKVSVVNTDSRLNMPGVAWDHPPLETIPAPTNRRVT